MRWLIDGNVLSALAISTHDHHNRAHNWFAGVRRFATCAVTQGTLLRVHMLMAADQSAEAAWQTLEGIVSHPQHEFWDDGFSYLEVSFRLLQGRKQVTDAWLVELARRRSGRLATLDASLATLHKESFLIPV
jgi:uncharacterized protein